MRSRATSGGIRYSKGSSGSDPVALTNLPPHPKIRVPLTHECADGCRVSCGVVVLDVSHEPEAKQRSDDSRRPLRIVDTRIPEQVVGRERREVERLVRRSPHAARVQAGRRTPGRRHLRRALRRSGARSRPPIGPKLSQEHQIRDREHEVFAEGRSPSGQAPKVAVRFEESRLQGDGIAQSGGGERLDRDVQAREPMVLKVTLALQVERVQVDVDRQRPVLRELAHRMKMGAGGWLGKGRSRTARPLGSVSALVIYDMT